LSGWHGFLVGKSSDAVELIGLHPLVGDFDDVTAVLLVDGPDITAVDVVGAVRVIIVTVVVVDDTMTTTDFTCGVLTAVGLVVATLYGSVTSVDFEVVAKTVDVAATDGIDLVVSVVDVSVVLSLDNVVVVVGSLSEMTTASWKSNSISGNVVVVAGVVAC